jgi:predicted aspartyl protease
MGNKTLFRCLALCLLLCVNAVAKHSNDAQKVPFKLYRKHLVVVTGRLGQIEHRNLLIDTGASPTVVDEALAHELGLKPIGFSANGMTVIGGVTQTYYAVLQSLDLGPVHRDSLVVAVANLSLMQAGAGLRIDAIVGFDTLAPNSFQIDYVDRKITFGSVRTPASAVPMLPGMRFAVIETEVNGALLKLAVDTGSSQLVLFRNGLPDTITSLPSTNSVQVSNVAGDVISPEIQLANFTVGGNDLSGSTALLANVPDCCEFQGILGITAWRFRRITFDFQRALFGLELADEDASGEPLAGACSALTRASCQPPISPGFVHQRK